MKVEGERVDGLLLVVPGNFWSSTGVGGFALFARGGPASWSEQVTAHVEQSITLG